MLFAAVLLVGTERPLSSAPCALSNQWIPNNYPAPCNRYAAEEGHACPLTAIISICNPFDLHATESRCASGIWKLYDWGVAATLRLFVIANRHVFIKAPWLDWWRLLTGLTIRDFDDTVTIKAFGHESVDVYR